MRFRRKIATIAMSVMCGLAWRRAANKSWRT